MSKISERCAWARTKWSMGVTGVKFNVKTKGPRAASSFLPKAAYTGTSPILLRLVVLSPFSLLGHSPASQTHSLNNFPFIIENSKCSFQ